MPLREIRAVTILVSRGVPFFGVTRAGLSSSMSEASLPCFFMLLAFNKPFGIITQFRSDGSPNRTLAEFGFPKGVYPIGRLDADSEGLLLLSDEPELNRQLLHPRHAHEREYWAQVERIPTAKALRQ